MRDDPAPLSSLLCPGLVTASTARLWMRSPNGGRLWMRLFEEGSDRVVFESEVDVSCDESEDFTASLLLPADVPGLEPLRSNTAYRAIAAHRTSGDQVGEARFTTSPLGNEDCPDTLAFAVASCNQPFEDDGSPSPRARALARLVPDALRSQDVSRLLLVGDQMYTDMPQPLSLFDEDYFRTIAPERRGSILECTREEVRRILHLRYRHFWKFPELQELLSSWPVDLRPDDHEIVDNFGSAPEHSTARYRNFKDGALDAFFDYQALRAFPRTRAGRPAAFDHAFTHGSVAFFAADLRSEKQADETRTRIMSDRQFRSLERFLFESSEKHVVVVILSVPILHVPDWLATTAAFFGGESSDAADRWSYQKAVPDRDRMLRILCSHQAAHPRQRVVIVGGDVHIGLACELMWEAGPRPVYQLVSSALTNKHSPWLQHIAELAPRIEREVCECDGAPIFGRLLPSAGGADRNPVGDLNFGTVHVHRVSEDESTVRLRLHSLVEQGGVPEVRCAFDSGEL